MKTKTLLRALKVASPALHHRDFVPILTHFCFDEDRVFAYDDKSAVIVLEETGLKCAVPGRALLQILADAGEEVKVEQEKNEIVITDGDGVVRLPILGKDAFVFDVPDLDAGIEIELSESLTKCLDFAAACSNVETIRAELLGVTLKTGRDGLYLYSTDNRTCTRALLDVELPPKAKVATSIIIPKSSAELLTKVFRDLKDDLDGATLLIAEKYVMGQYVVKGDKAPVVVVCKAIAATPEDFERVVAPHLDKAEYLDVPEGTDAALRRCMTVQSADLEKRCTVQTLDTDFLLIEAHGGLGKVEARLKAKGAGNSPELLTNPALLLRALEYCSEMSVSDEAVCLRGSSDDYVLEQAVAKISK